MENEIWLTSQQQRAWKALQFMHMQLDSRLAGQLARDSAMAYGDYVVLVALTECESNRLRINDLGQKLGWESSRLSHHLSRMVKRQLVEKERCEEDKRGSWVVATEKGRRAIEKAAPGHVAEVKKYFFSVLNDDQVELLEIIAQQVLANLKGVEPPTGKGR